MSFFLVLHAKLSFLSDTWGFFTPAYLLYNVEKRTKIEYSSHVLGGTPSPLLFHFDRVYRKAIRLIDDLFSKCLAVTRPSSGS